MLSKFLHFLLRLWILWTEFLIRQLNRWIRPQLPPQKPFLQSLHPPHQLDAVSIRPTLDLGPENKATQFDQTTPEWRSEMRRVGEQLRVFQLARVMVVHGTFVGHDPLSLQAAAKLFFPALPATFEALMGNLIRKHMHQLVGDCGNFTNGWMEMLKKGTGMPCPVEYFPWSGANFHYARLEAAANLIHHLSTNIKDTGRDILLIGHSHAGQVFALVTQLVHPTNASTEHLLRVLDKAGWNLTALDESCRKLARQWFHMVTLGTPPRYTFSTPEERVRLLHIINHRRKDPLAGDATGFLTTREGDYIQQWGIGGSDFLAPANEIQEKNHALDEILGPGCSPMAWLQGARGQMRVPRQGTTWLVDMGDDGKDSPNCVQTLFGHGAYTRVSHQLAVFRLVSEWFNKSI